MPEAGTQTMYRKLGGKHRMVRRRASKSTRSTKRRKTATKRNSDAISTLMRTSFPITRYQRVDVGTVDAKIHTFLITQPSSFTECFRSYNVPDADVPRSYDMHRVQGKWTVQVESQETGNAWCQCFIVSVKSSVAAKTLARTTRLGALTEGLDYTQAAMGTAGGSIQGHSFFFLNPALYNVHYKSGVRRLGGTTMGDDSVTNIRDSTTRGTYNIPWKRTFKNDEYAASGFRAISVGDIEPKNQLYFVMLSNADKSELFLAHNALITGRQATSQ